MDADGQHDPADIQKLLAGIPDYDMVVGARSLKGQASFGRAFGNKVFNWLASYVAKFPIQDLTSGFRAIKADVARSFTLSAAEHLLLSDHHHPGRPEVRQSLKYVPIESRRRQKGKSHIKLVNDGVRFFMIIIRICTLYSPMRVFLPVSFGDVCGGSCPLYLHLHHSTVVSRT